MPTIEVDCGNGIGLNKNNELIVKVDEEKKEELKVSENGVWAKGIKRLNDQCVDNWSVVEKPADKDHQNDPKNIMGNGRVVNKLRIFSFMKHARTYSESEGVWYLKCKDPNKHGVDSVDLTKYLKDADDIVRELNFSSFFSDGTNHGPLCLPRPGTMIGFSDAIYGTTKYSTKIYEDGKRFPTFIHYKYNNGAVEEETIAQHLYALFIVNDIQYTNYDAKSNYNKNIKKHNGANGTGYKVCYNIRMQCLWSDQQAFNGLLNTEGWRKGEFLKGKNNHTYGQQWYDDVFGLKPSDI